VLSITGLSHIDVVAGQGKPLMRPTLICPEIHGNTGLDSNNVGFPPITKKAVNKKAINHMYETIIASPEPVTIVATGALTNVALLLTVYPEIKSKISQLSILGGSIGIGNISPAAEFNILIDPEAARIVFESGLAHFVMVPLEVSHTALVTPNVVERIAKMNSNFSRLAVDLLHFFADSYKKVFGFEFPPLHDPLAVAYVINPSISDDFDES